MKEIKEDTNGKTSHVHGLEDITTGLPCGAVVKNPPANAGTQVRALVQEYPTCRGATKPMRHNY